MNTFEINKQLLNSASNRQKEILLMYHAAASALKEHIERNFNQNIEPTDNSIIIDVESATTSVTEPENIYYIEKNPDKISNFNLSKAKNIPKKKISIYG